PGSGGVGATKGGYWPRSRKTRLSRQGPAEVARLRRIRVRPQSAPAKRASRARAPARLKEPSTTPTRSKVGFSTLIHVIVSVSANRNSVNDGLPWILL